jgi:hypothetical protein
MSTPFSRYRMGGFVLVALVLLLLSTPAHANEDGRIVPVLLAESKGGWSIGSIFSGLNNRTRIIQFCTAIMCLGLYILMRKLAPQRPTVPSRPRNETNTPPHS